MNAFSIFSSAKNLLMLNNWLIYNVLINLPNQM